MECREGGCQGKDKMTEAMTTKMPTMMLSWGIRKSTIERGDGMQGVESGESCCQCLCQGYNNNNKNDSNSVSRRTVVLTMWPQPNLHVNHGSNCSDRVANTMTSRCLCGEERQHDNVLEKVKRGKTKVWDEKWALALRDLLCTNARFYLDTWWALLSVIMLSAWCLQSHVTCDTGTIVLFKISHTKLWPVASGPWYLP